MHVTWFIACSLIWLLQRSYAQSSFPYMKQDSANRNYVLRFIKGFVIVLLAEYVIRIFVPISHCTFPSSLINLVLHTATFRTHYVSVEDVSITKSASQSVSLLSGIRNTI